MRLVAKVCDFAWHPHRYQIWKSCRTGIWPLHWLQLVQASSILSVIAPSLPWYPGFKGKVTNPSFILFRSPGRPDRVSASKVSPSADLCSIDVCRSRFDLATLMAGCMDSVLTFWWVSKGLGESGMSAISLFIFSCRFVIDMLDLDLYISGKPDFTI